MPVVPLLVITIGPTCRDFLPKAKPTIQGEQVIPDGNVLAGTLPPGKTRLVQAWIEIHQEELIADWRLTVNGEEPFRIAPLR